MSTGLVLNFLHTGARVPDLRINYPGVILYAETFLLETAKIKVASFEAAMAG